MSGRCSGVMLINPDLEYSDAASDYNNEQLMTTPYSLPNVSGQHLIIQPINEIKQDEHDGEKCPTSFIYFLCKYSFLLPK